MILILAGDISDPSNTVNNATPVQCIIDGRTRPHTFQFDQVLNGLYLLVFVLLHVYIKHTYALFNDPQKVADSKVPTIQMSLARSREQLKVIPRKERKNLLRMVNLQSAILLDPKLASADGSGSRGFTRYQYSFMSYLPTILFSMAYGISQTVAITWFDNPKTTDDARRMGFGQVVALALLAIPALTASEIYNGEQAAISPLDFYFILTRSQNIAFEQ